MNRPKYDKEKLKEAGFRLTHCDKCKERLPIKIGEISYTCPHCGHSQTRTVIR